MKACLRSTVFLLLAGWMSLASAAPFFTIKNVFIGGGLSLNKVPGSDRATGVQAFGGYSFGEFAPKLFLDAEAGYLDTGRFEFNGVPGRSRARGPWTTGVARYLVVPSVELLGRAGLDLGDDDGPMFGLGVGLIASRNLKVRLEYVVRDNVDSLQVNLLVLPWR